MSFTPFARYRNFTLANLKALLEVYPDMASNISWDEAKDYAEVKAKGYKRTAYQQACQFGLEDRTAEYFRIHSYLYTFDDDNLSRYLVFWFKTYFAPNPYVKSADESFLLYCRLCEDILQSENHSVNFEDFIERNIGGKSDDILLNAIKTFAAPVKYREIGSVASLYIEDALIEDVKHEVDFIKTTYPIGNPKSEHEFFERFSYSNFCKFYGENEDPSVEDSKTIKKNKSVDIELPFDQSKTCARQLVDCIYQLDGFKSLSSVLKNNDKNIKVLTEDLGGNYLRYMFAKTSSDFYESANGDKTRVFTDEDYYINIDGETEKCRLSTEWVSTDLGENGTSANYLKALVEVINKYYYSVLQIFEESGKWYLKYLKQKFITDELPERFNDGFSQRYIRSLLAKPFVILTGNSGTGKTRIAKQFAQYLEKKVDGKKNWLIVPVGADWTDNTKMLGFYNPLEKKYVSTPALEFILQAEKNPHVPYFLILDEMNLSHVERYFSDFLSAMESEEEIPLYKVPEDTSADSSKKQMIPESIRIPKNLFVTGTVNIDETTYMFSSKVLDRSNVVEFKSAKDDVLKLMISPSENEMITAANDGSAESFVALALYIGSGECGVDTVQLTHVQTFLNGIYEDLQEGGFEFAYRTVKEIRQYIAAAYALKADNFDITKITDEQVVQKILPKIYGDRKQIGVLLEKLKKNCKDGVVKDANVAMDLSIKKIEQMENRLDKYQYASFM